MKKIIAFALMATVCTTMQTACAQDDKSKRPSPPATETAKLTNGAVVTINYSQPSVKGRSIGKEIAQYGKVWRTGANESTTFETSKGLKVNGNALPAGKYSIFTIPEENEWTVIFNKINDQWGTRYKETEDVFRFKVKPSKGKLTEQMKFTIDKEGIVKLNWATTMISFQVE